MIQEVIFPDGISLDVKNRQYLTKNMNVVFALIQELMGKVEEKEKGLIQNIPEKSLIVAGTRVELVTSGL
jgi:hypothetical protein